MGDFLFTTSVSVKRVYIRPGSTPTADKFYIDVSYYPRGVSAKRKGANCVQHAKSNDIKWQLPPCDDDHMPTTFESEKAAEIWSKTYRRHVEDTLKERRNGSVYKGGIDPGKYEANKRKSTNLAALKRKKAKTKAEQAEAATRAKACRADAFEQRVKAWQDWRLRVCAYLGNLIESERTWLLVEGATKLADSSLMSKHVITKTLQKSIALRMFLFRCHARDEDRDHFKVGGAIKVEEIAAAVGKEIGVSKAYVQKAYREYTAASGRGGNENSHIGSFKKNQRGSWERDWILEQHDLKQQLTRFMKRNVKELSVDLVQTFINNKLLNYNLARCAVTQSCLREHRIELPICRDTARSWMKRCGAEIMRTGKCYYNDKHDDPVVIEQRTVYIKKMKKLQRRMRVWVSLTKEEEDDFQKRKKITEELTGKLFQDALPPEEVDGKFVHHIDECESWIDKGELHPLFNPGVRGDDFECLCVHDAGIKCKCAMEIIHIGQDESVYHAGDVSHSRWGVHNKSWNVSKSRGKAVHVSAFKEFFQRGFGLRLSPDELAELNQERAKKEMPPLTESPELAELNQERAKKEMSPLTESPGLVLMTPGNSEGADGYWNAEKLQRQVKDVVHMYGHFHPDKQLLMEFDWSSGHAKKRVDGLNVSSAKIAVKYGKKREEGTTFRDSTMTEGCLGTNTAELWKKPDGTWSATHCDGATRVSCKLKVGEVQHFDFPPADAEEKPPPPFYELDAPLEDTPILDADGKPCYDSKGVPMIRKGYAGTAKGLKQVLWERGLYLPGMIAKVRVDDGGMRDMSLSMRDVLAKCEDFANEKGELEELIRQSGHLCMFSPKGHPELAGAGVEYDWGVSKMTFRKRKRRADKFCEEEVRATFKVLTLQLVRKTARRARIYARAYASDSRTGATFSLIEKFVKAHRTHRNILDQETSFLGRAIAEARVAGGTHTKGESTADIEDRKVVRRWAQHLRNQQTRMTVIVKELDQVSVDAAAMEAEPVGKSDEQEADKAGDGAFPDKEADNAALPDKASDIVGDALTDKVAEEEEYDSGDEEEEDPSAPAAIDITVGPPQSDDDMESFSGDESSDCDSDLE